MRLFIAQYAILKKNTWNNRIQSIEFDFQLVFGLNQWWWTTSHICLLNSIRWIGTIQLQWKCWWIELIINFISKIIWTIDWYFWYFIENPITFLKKTQAHQTKQLLVTNKNENKSVLQRPLNQSIVEFITSKANLFIFERADTYYTQNGKHTAFFTPKTCLL